MVGRHLPAAAGPVDLGGALGPGDRERLVALGVAHETGVLAASRRHHAVLFGKLGRHWGQVGEGERQSQVRTFSVSDKVTQKADRLASGANDK